MYFLSIVLFPPFLYRFSGIFATVHLTVNKTVPNKNPKVFKEYFSTDPLTQSESVLLGRALAKIDELKAYGKTVTTFRLFDGKMYSSEDATKPIKKRRK